jgi:hypothetical protein
MIVFPYSFLPQHVEKCLNASQVSWARAANRRKVQHWQAVGAINTVYHTEYQCILTVLKSQLPRLRLRLMRKTWADQRSPQFSAFPANFDILSFKNRSEEHSVSIT